MTHTINNNILRSNLAKTSYWYGMSSTQPKMDSKGDFRPRKNLGKGI